MTIKGIPLTNILYSRVAPDNNIHLFDTVYTQHRASLIAQQVKTLPAMQETLGWSLVEKRSATQSSILSWRIPWTKEPGRLQSMRLQSQTQLSDIHTQHIVLSTLQILTQSSQWPFEIIYYYVHFTCEEAQSQRDLITCLILFLFIWKGGEVERSRLEDLNCFRLWS